MSPTDVLLTVDLEFSSGGFLDDPNQFKPVGAPSVELQIGGKSHGLGYLLETLSHYGAIATFFVEAAHVLYFGPEPMAMYVEQLRKAGHDVQLHLHPQWIYCQQVKSGLVVDNSNITDSMADLSSSQLTEIIETGIQAFHSWGIEPPIALRTGNLQVNDLVYRIMLDMGLELSSNIGVGVYQPKQRHLHLYSGRHRINGVLEIPVFSYRGLRFGKHSRIKTLTITGSSAAETRYLLSAAHAAGISEVVILTHVHEMIKRTDARYMLISPNNINQRRLRQLCQFVSNNSENFRFSTFADKYSEWKNKPDTNNQILNVPNRLTAISVSENMLNDLFRPS